MSDTIHLDYGAFKKQQTRRKSIVLVVISVICSAFCLLATTYVESCNIGAGGILPKHDVGKWTHASITSERSWRNWRAIREEDDSWRSRALTPDEQIEMERLVSMNRRENAVLTAIQSSGIWIYVVAPVAIILGIIIWFRFRRFGFATAVGVCGMVAGPMCLGVAIYHGYWSSLGM